MNRVSKPGRRFITGIILGLMLACMGPFFLLATETAAAADDVTIKVNGNTVKLDDPAFVSQGRLYVPAAQIAQKLGATSSWDKEQEEIIIHTAFNDKAVLGNGVPVVYFNGARYVMDAFPMFKDGRLYMPLIHLAELLHAEMTVKSEGDLIELKQVDRAVVADKYGLTEISKEAGISKAELLKRNGLDSKSTIKPGAKLKILVPSFIGNPADPYTEAELTLLAKITMVEAGYESYEGQLAIANVILNRVKDSRFPGTIRDVIYSGRQFPPAHNGLLDKSKPHATALRAAKDALNGKNNVKNAVYFFNPKFSKGSFWSSMDVIITIGHHSFAK
ncbi:cell wall hydrolase [Paenibacillus tarimensis]|uniref:cell wall hydrolase n=1 Tax=Paenibacillus tarimensis TaxID=416012 RepID=UPI001F43296B|nr:cell wall hydrolase [Paenibacillus tarimensis]MCF2943128.1 cell wall hydrolase [Paenibacillus tarimensis]